MTARHLARNLKALDGLYSPQKMIDETGLSPRTLYAMRSGPMEKSRPQITSIEKVANAVGLWPSVLLWTNEDADREAQLVLGRPDYDRHSIFDGEKDTKTIGIQLIPMMEMYEAINAVKAIGLITAFSTRSIEAGKKVARYAQNHSSYIESGNSIEMEG